MSPSEVGPRVQAAGTAGSGVWHRGPGSGAEPAGGCWWPSGPTVWPTAWLTELWGQEMGPHPTAPGGARWHLSVAIGADCVTDRAVALPLGAPA